jgi:hypothetical protein
MSGRDLVLDAIADGDVQYQVTLRDKPYQQEQAVHAYEDPGYRVARGIERLAPACPRWWAADGQRHIDPHAIDLTDPARGILAAVYGSHAEGLRLLHILPETAPEYGFAALNAADAQALQRAWLHTVVLTRAEHDSRPPR